VQKKKLQTLYDDKVKPLVKKLLTLDGDSERFVVIYIIGSTLIGLIQSLGISGLSYQLIYI